MPVSAYYGGHGSQVLAAMRKRYGPKKGTSVFYATANARKQTPENALTRARRRKRKR